MASKAPKESAAEKSLATKLTATWAMKLAVDPVTEADLEALIEAMDKEIRPKLSEKFPATHHFSYQARRTNAIREAKKALNDRITASKPPPTPLPQNAPSVANPVTSTPVIAQTGDALASKEVTPVVTPPEPPKPQQTEGQVPSEVPAPDLKSQLADEFRQLRKDLFDEIPAVVDRRIARYTGAPQDNLAKAQQAMATGDRSAAPEIVETIEDLPIDTALIERTVRVTPTFLQLFNIARSSGYTGDEGMFISVVVEEWAARVKGIRFSVVKEVGGLKMQ